MKRTIPALVFAILGAAVAVLAEPTATKPAETKPAKEKAYTTHEEISNPDVEAIVKIIPKTMYPPPKDDSADKKDERRKASAAWQRENIKDKKITAEAIVLSSSIGAFRIASMENTLITLTAGTDQDKDSTYFGTFKQGDRVKVEGTLRRVAVLYFAGELQIDFSINHLKVTKALGAATTAASQSAH